MSSNILEPQELEDLDIFLAWGWNSGQSSPTSTKDFKKFVVIRVAGDEKNEAGLSRYQIYRTI